MERKTRSLCRVARRGGVLHACRSHVVAPHCEHASSSVARLDTQTARGYGRGGDLEETGKEEKKSLTPSSLQRPTTTSQQEERTGTDARGGGEINHQPTSSESYAGSAEEQEVVVQRALV